MTNDMTDMSSPVTRGELRDELAQLERKLDDNIDRLDRKFENNLGLWGGALGAQIGELAAQIRELATQMSQSETRMLNELARHSQAGFEARTRSIAAVDEKYSDLPARVTRLEINALK